MVFEVSHTQIKIFKQNFELYLMAEHQINLLKFPILYSIANIYAYIRVETVTSDIYHTRSQNAKGNFIA